MKIGALEAGGTKMVLGIFDENGKSLDIERLPTRSPEITIPLMRNYFLQHDIDALGIGSFGPLELNRQSKKWGWITSTPKAEWKNCPLVELLTKGMNIPVEIDTDVNAAALAEAYNGAARGCKNIVYVTIGTGIGAGVLVNGEPLHGMIHPEVGHMLMSRVDDDPLERGVCSYHKSCLEGFASGPAITKRAGTDASILSDDSPVFKIEADYLGQMCANLIMCYSPERIILGGGVMDRPRILEDIRINTKSYLSNYIQHPNINEHIDDYIVIPLLYPLSGLVGSWLLGMKALQSKQCTT